MLTLKQDVADRVFDLLQATTTAEITPASQLRDLFQVIWFMSTLTCFLNKNNILYTFIYIIYIYLCVCVALFKSIESLWVSTWKGCTKPLFPKRQDKAGEVEYAVFMSHFESVLGPVTPSGGKPRRDFGRPRMVFPWSEISSDLGSQNWCPNLAGQKCCDILMAFSTKFSVRTENDGSPKP